MKYLYFVGILSVLVVAVISLNLFDTFGYLIMILVLMLLTGIVLRYNDNGFAKDLGWGLCAAVVAFVIFFIVFFIWMASKITC